MGELHGSLRPNPCVNIVGLSSLSSNVWQSEEPYLQNLTTWRGAQDVLLARAVEKIPRWEAPLCHACFLPPSRFRGTAANWPWAPPWAVWRDKDREQRAASNFISERVILWYTMNAFLYKGGIVKLLGGLSNVSLLMGWLRLILTLSDKCVTCLQ